MALSGGPGLARAAMWWAAERPDAPAIMEAGRTWTWAQLAERAAGIAARMTSGMVVEGQPSDRRPRVAAEPPAGGEGVVMLHALAMAGVQAVVIPPRWSIAERDALIAAVAPWRLLRAGGHEGGGEGPTGIVVEDVALPCPPIASPSAATPRTSCDLPGELVVPTSGTTRRPRLARLPLDRIDASVDAWRAVLPPATGWLLSLGLAHVAGIGIVARAGAAGVPVVVPAPDVRLAEALAEVPVSHASLVAVQLARLLEVDRDAPPPSGIRCVLLGGGPIPASLVARALVARWPVWPSYGQTETASGVAAATPEQAGAHPDRAGVALPGVELRLSPAEMAGAAGDPGAEDAAGGRSGELQVRGPMVFAGYLDDPSATAARFTDEGWLRTGDLARLDPDGGLRIIDRLDDVLISGGENIAPAEVEAVVGALPGVMDVAVVGVPHDEWGEVPVAVVVPRPGADRADAELLAAAGARLAGFRRPHRILRAAALPRGAAEKLQRRALRAPAAAAMALRLPPAVQGGAPLLEQRLLLADDGQPLLLRVSPRAEHDDRPALLMLHATLSSGAQLVRLAAELAPVARVVLLDRRGSGGSLMAEPAPVPVERHVADAWQALAACGEPVAHVFGHSFGGVVGTTLAARRPDLVRGLVAWEPPYLPLATPADRRRLAGAARRAGRIHATEGAAGAARAFMAMIAPGAWERLRPTQRAELERAGSGVLVDAAMAGLDPDDLGRVRCPVVLGTGGASEPFYAPIAAALAARIPSATVVRLDGLVHVSPIVSPRPIAALVRSMLAAPPHASTTSQEPMP